MLYNFNKAVRIEITRIIHVTKESFLDFFLFRMIYLKQIMMMGDYKYYMTSVV